MSTKNNITNSNYSCQNCLNINCLIYVNRKNQNISKFVENKKLLRCKKGQQFIMEGAMVNGLFIILEGTAKVFRTGINGKEQIVRFAKDGEVVGHRGFGTEESYPIGAVALEDTLLCYFSKEHLQEALLSSAKLSYDMMLFYANELNRSESKVKTISQMTVRERVIDTLLYINRKFGTTGGYLNLLLTRKEYADYAGTTEEQVIRTFSSLKKEQFIGARGKKISILDVEGLKAEISQHNFFLDS
ncbi:Putative transcriptional regulator, Crp/Fnr family [Tenacibaculum jejuense]|uniref:Putative transcriptional regulator, Crp/Fnr family n=1 Tax=Tenacibaculum jejuense TaxID=584609 RepID=A0A238UBD3_9FLAO|nr:Putative transcriptional regulator, Crp/Fnr family [Tenacibaculum jejuense]